MAARRARTVCVEGAHDPFPKAHASDEMMGIVPSLTGVKFKGKGTKFGRCAPLDPPRFYANKRPKITFHRVYNMTSKIMWKLKNQQQIFVARPLPASCLAGLTTPR